MHTYSYYIVFIGDCSEIVLFFLFLLFLKRTRKYPWLLALVASITTLTGLTMILSAYKLNNLWIYHLIGLVELILIQGFYKRLHLQRWVNVVFSIVLIYYLFDSFFIESLLEMNALGRSISTLYLLALNLYFYLYTYQKEEIFEVSKSLVFFFNVGLTFYLAGSFFAFLMSNEIMFTSTDTSDFFYHGWVLHSMAQVMKNLIIGVALIKLRKR